MGIDVKKDIFMMIILTICTNTVANPEEYPKRWIEKDNMPAIETMDYIKLPYNFGYGSGTRLEWIKNNILEDLDQGIVWEKAVDK